MAKRRKAGSIASAWKGAKEKGGTDVFSDAVPVPKGNYLMQLVGIQLDDTDDGTKLHKKWCVVEASEDSDVGKLCSDWEGPLSDEERCVWVMREMVKLGVDVEEFEPETDQDIVAEYESLIENVTIVKMRVVEKNDWLNLKLGAVIDEPDEDLIVDPEAALEGTAASGGDNADYVDADSDEGDEGDLEVGAQVTWSGRCGGALTGEIIGWTDDDDAKVKCDQTNRSVTVAVEKLTKADDDAGPGGEGGDEHEWAVGDRVWNNEFGEDFPGVIGSIATGANDTKGILVEHDDGDKSQNGFADLNLIEAVGRAPDDDDGDEGDEGDYSEGDRVLAVHPDDGESYPCEVVSVEGEAVTVRADEDDEEWEVEASELQFEPAA